MPNEHYWKYVLWDCPGAFVYPAVDGLSRCRFAPSTVFIVMITDLLVFLNSTLFHFGD